MRGEKERSEKLFYTFSLDQAVPSDHPLRRLSSVIDWDFVYPRTRGLYYHAGPKSVDPVVVLKVLMLNFLHNIGSIRETMRQSADRLSFRWFLGYDIDEALPTHSAISKNLARFGPDLFQELFGETVRLCVQHGLVGGALVHVDSTTVKANASNDSVALTPEALHPDPEETSFHPDLAPSSYWKQVKEEAAKAHPNVNDRLSSATDPEADILSRDGKNRMLAYKDHRAVDDKHGVIVGTQATGAAITDQEQFQALVDEVLVCRGLMMDGIAADRIYGTVDNYKYLWSRGIEPTLPRKNATRRKGKFGKERFQYDASSDHYICPAGEVLKPQGKTHDNYELYRASGPVCAACGLREQCVAGKKSPRTIRRDRDEGYVEWALRDRHTDGFRTRMRRRMAVVEGSFGQAKNWHGHHRTRWRGRWKVQVQCYLVAAIQNLKILLQWAGKPAGNGGGILAKTDFARIAVSVCGFLTRFWRVRRYGMPVRQDIVPVLQMNASR